MQVNGSLGQQKLVYKGYLDCVRTMAATEGLGAFYRGFTVSCIKTAPSAAIQARPPGPKLKCKTRRTLCMWCTSMQCFWSLQKTWLVLWQH